MWRNAQGARVNLEAQIHALAAKSTAELAADYTALFGRAPRRRHPVYLRKRVGYRLQANALGGLPRVARAALDALMDEITLPAARAAKPIDDAPTGGRPRLGTVLEREWRGATYRVVATADGYQWDGRAFGSLSAVAQAITGAKWNGKLFFGLVGRSKP
jgi:hypothetical protein